MSQLCLRLVSRLLIAFTLLYAAAPRAQAQTSSNFNFGGIGPSGGQVAGAIIGVAAVIGVAAYFIARAPRTTGCVASGPDGLTLKGPNANDTQYLLEGETSTLHAGDRVKVIGRKHNNAARLRVIKVSRVAKTYGSCSAPVAMLLQP